MRYKAVSLDAGYTLLEPVRDGDAMVFDLLQAIEHPLPIEAVRAAELVANRYFFARYLTPNDDTWSVDRDIRALWQRYYQIMLAELGVDDHDLRLASAIVDHYNAPANWRTYPDVREVLAELQGRGYRLGIVSDWNSSLLGILRHLELNRYLDWVLASGQIGFAKPQAALYRLAIQRAGSPPDLMVHVGDSYYADVRGARAVGMDAILLDRQRRKPPTDCPIIHNLTELLTLV